MPCPWYRAGLCTSPKLREPSDAVVSHARCSNSSEYRLCNYYVEPSNTSWFHKGTARIARTRDELVWPPIHVLADKPTSNCQFFEAREYKRLGVKGYTAKCHILDRLLTVSETVICEKHHETCPLKRWLLCFRQTQHN